MPLNILSFTSNQLDVTAKVVKVLNLVEEMIRSISTDAASVSLIIPFIRALRLSLEKDDGSD